MDTELSRRVALGLIEARSIEDVQSVLLDSGAGDWFEDPQHWSPYGNRDKNWDTVGNQQTNPIGALVEIITNGIDTILLRKAKENDISDFRGEEAPQSMFEAVKRFFPHVVEGKIVRLSPKERSDLAQQCIRVGVSRGSRKTQNIYPTYTIIDSGDGQLPTDFPKTFLSLSERNKEGIPFVQGKFNMGSTGTLRFCTRSDIRLGHYKLIVSRRPGEQWWGWTLIRVREPRTGEALPVAEYFHPYQKVIPKFSVQSIQAFAHDSIGVITDGSIIKLYEYDIGPGARAVDFGLYNALTVSLIDCALPIQLYDFDAKPVEGKGPLRRQGIAERTFGGMNAVLRADMAEPTSEEDEGKLTPSNTEWVYLVEDIRDSDLGHIQIVATAVTKLKDFLAEQPARVFYTINGQTHAFERASFLNTRVGLPDLRSHVLINVVCDEMNKTAMATIFMPDRERKANTDLARKLEQRVIDALKGDDKLRAYAAEIRRRRASEYVEDEGETASLLQELINADPAIRELFGLGAFLPDLGKSPGGQEPFSGKKFPTFLKPLNLRSEQGRLVKEVPINASRRVECGTDADDDYLTRVDSPGEVWSSLDERQLPFSVKLRNGIARFSIQAPKGAEVGQEVVAEFGFKDFGRNLEPLKFSMVIKFTEPEEAEHRKGGKNSKTQPNQQQIIGEPKFEWVNEADWSEHDFDLSAGAYVATAETTVVYINHDNRYLKAMRVKEKDDATRMMNENMFRLGLGLLALSVHKKIVSTAKDDDKAQSSVEPEELTRLATSGMAPYIVTIIRRLGGADALQ